MPAEGDGIVVPVTIKVALESLNAVKSELESFKNAVTSTPKGESFTDPSTGAAQSAKQTADLVAQMQGKARQGIADAAAQLTRTDLTQSKRKELQGLIKDYENLSAAILRSSRDLRRSEPTSKPILSPVLPVVAPQPTQPPPAAPVPPRPGETRGGPSAKEVGPGGPGGPELTEGQQRAQRRIEEARKKRDEAEALRAQTPEGTGTGIETIAAGKALSAATERQIAIAQRKIDLEEENVRSAAEEKVLNDELNRALAAQVRAQEDVGAVAREKAAAQVHNAQVRQQEAEALREELPDGSGTGVQALGASKAAVAATEREVSIAQRKIDLEQENVRSAAEQKVLGDQLSREVAAQVRLQEDSVGIARETAAAQRARQEQQARVALEAAGVDSSRYNVKDAGQREQLLARAASVKRAEADQAAAAAARAAGASDIEATAARRVEEAKLRVSIERRQREIIRSQVEQGTISGGSGFQRLQSFLRPRAGKLPEEYQTATQFAGERLQRTVGFAISGGVLYGAIGGLREMVKLATEFEKSLLPLQAALNKIGAGDQIAGLRTQLLGISADTGAAATDVARAAQAFTAINGTNVNQTLADTNAAMQLMAVTGQDVETVLATLRPVMQAFGMTAAEVGDQIISSAANYSTTADDVGKFVAKVSTVGNVLGKNFKEAEALGGNLSKAFGIPMEQTGDIITKQADLIEKNIGRVVTILQSAPQTAAAGAKISRDFSTGDRVGALVELQRASAQMNDAQRNAIENTLGTPQDAQLMIGLLGTAASTIRDIGKAQKEAGSDGALKNQFEQMKDTLSSAFNMLKSAFTEIGDALLRAGLGDALRDIAIMLGAVVTATSLVTRAFAGLNEITGGLVGHIAVAAALFAGLVKVQELLNRVRNAGTRAAGEQAVSEGADATAKQENVVATNELTGAEERELAVRRESAAVGPGSRIAAASPARAARAAEAEAAAEAETAATAERSAANAALYGGGALSRLRQRAPAFGGSYDTRLARASGALGTVRPGQISGMDKALAGGKFLRVPEADAALTAENLAAEEAGVEGAASGLMASPLMTGAIIATAMVAVTSKYMEMKGKVDQASDYLQSQVKHATDANLAQASQNVDTLGDRFSAWFFQKPVTTDYTKAEQLARASTPQNRQLGLPTSSGPTQSEQASQAWQDQLDSKATDINRRIVDSYQTDDYYKIVNETFKTETGRKLAADTKGPAELRAAVMDTSKDKDRDPRDQQDVQNLRNAYADVEKHAPSKLLDELKGLGQQKNLKGAIDAAGGDYDKAFGALTQWGDDTFRSFDDLQKSVQNGSTSSVEFREEAQKSLNGLRAAALSKEPGEQREQALAAYEERQHIYNAYFASLAATDDAVKDALSAATSTTPKQEQASRHALATASKDYTDRLAALPGQIQQDVAAQQEQWSQIQNPEARKAALAQGIKIDAGSRRTEIEERMRADPRIKVKVLEASKKYGMTENEIYGKISQIAMERNESAQEAAAQFMQELVSTRARAEGNVGSIAERAGVAAGKDFGSAFSDVVTPEEYVKLSPAQQQLESLKIDAETRQSNLRLAESQAPHDKIRSASLEAKAAAETLNDTIASNKIKGGASDAQVKDAMAAKNNADQNLADSMHELAVLQMNRAVILANHDPVAENAAQVKIAYENLRYAQKTGDRTGAEQAAQQLMQLQQQAAENMLNITRGTMAMQAAQDQQDPLKSAKDALQRAEFELANAHGEADRRTKFAAVTTARQGLQDAISNSLSAEAQLAIDLAELRNDPVSAAADAAQEAKRKLDEAVAKNITDSSVIAPLTAQLAKANHAAFLAPINKQISDLDFLYNMQQISLGSYVSMLETELSKLDVNSKEYQELALKIFNLKKGSQADLAFDLPGQLKLPTLYETRRASQTVFTPGGGGYQDNRNVQVTIAVNGVQDPVAVANQVSSALNNSLRSGNAYSASIPVGTGL